jgi:ribosomal protein L11 methyltransferase
VYESDGVAASQVQNNGPYDLVIANILAGPLCTLAPSIRDVCAPGAYVILSGLLDAQAPQVQAAYAQEGYVVIHHLQLSGWSTLTLQFGS